MTNVSVTGFNITANGSIDMTYNSRRNIFGAIPLRGNIVYHLFKVDVGASKLKDIVRLCRKTKWHSQHRTPSYCKIVLIQRSNNDEQII